MAKTILIIDDEQAILDVYSKELAFHGYTVIVAGDADEGYKKAISKSPDLILLDIMLPGASGLELLKQLRNNEKTKDIKIVMLTNLDASAVIDEGYELGADAYFVKAELVPSQVAEEIKAFL